MIFLLLFIVLRGKNDCDCRYFVSRRKVNCCGIFFGGYLEWGIIYLGVGIGRLFVV